MSAASIKDTITAVVTEELGESTSYYAEAIEKVTAALTEREHTIVEEIVEKADEFYGSGYGEKAEELLSEAGLAVRPAPEPEPVVVEASAADTSDLSDTDRIALLEEGQRKQSESIGKLLELADKIGTHLGLNN